MYTFSAFLHLSFNACRGRPVSQHTSGASPLELVTPRLAMVRCPRCSLHNSIKLLNLIMVFFAIGIIIYSLWLDKKWHQFFSELHPASPPPKPWFIYTCSGVGIAVCLSTLCGYMAVNSISNYTICSYIFIGCCLLFLEVAVIVIVFFKMDLLAQIASSIDECHKKIESFLRFHMNAVALSVIFWAARMESRIDFNQSNATRFTQSFLVPNFPESETSRQSFTRYEILPQQIEQGALLSYIRKIRERFQRRNNTH
ncbi:uncharacterized protein LOC110644139 isoform X2 [Hevea brasiliensis]|uniref:uncharacterized protein LOC110644139 isoform X2 n=1 Tax=Hevea brasiliensis TaxID=3981 RepID=UPI0025D99EF7|nr:uncharacterized protein LOC110644139 isoform X2 [Hevea brasiliensis]